MDRRVDWRRGQGRDPRRTATLWRRVLLLAVCAGLIGCSKGDGEGSEKTSSSKPPDLEIVSGPWTGTVRLDPSPSVVGENRLELDLSDDGGEPVEGATVKISPWMPAHGHGSVDVVANESEPGHYATDKLYLNMAGLWELRFQVTLADEKGRLVASFEVP